MPTTSTTLNNIFVLVSISGQWLVAHVCYYELHRTTMNYTFLLITTNNYNYDSYLSLSIYYNVGC